MYTKQGLFIYLHFQEKMHPASYSAVKQTKFTSIGILKRKVESLSQEIIKKEGKHPVIKVMIEIPQSPVDKMSPSAEFTNPYLQGTCIFCILFVRTCQFLLILL